MNSVYSPDYLAGLVREMCKLPNETDWIEFKVNYKKPQEIGEYISALSNSAALQRKTHAYLVWGIEDATHSVVGTDFSPGNAKKGNEPLETWLLRLLNPRIDFHFHETVLDGKRIVLLEIDLASRSPVAFNGREFIRVGTTKRNLKDFPEKERALWRIFDRISFEDGIAAEQLSGEKVLLSLNYPAYFHLLGIPLPDGRANILERLEQDQIISRCETGGFNITNLGAILFARDLDDFPKLRRKAVRVIQYNGPGRTSTAKEKEGHEGYAAGFEGLIEYINGILPAHEVIEQALRKEVKAFPETAVRELVANAIIHQDFLITGAGPMIEIFDDRIEITNPGEPLVDVRRFLDSPPVSRNERLASLMRRFRICEERGSGVAKVVEQVEHLHLPAPLFETPPNFTRSVLYSRKPLSDMRKADRIRACYLHACLRYVTGTTLTNSSLRQRFGIEEKNKASVSRYIRESIEANMIKPLDAEAAPKLMKYIPFWAHERQSD